MKFYTNTKKKNLPIYQDLIDKGIVKVVQEAFDLKGNPLPDDVGLYCEDNHRKVVFDTKAALNK